MAGIEDCFKELRPLISDAISDSDIRKFLKQSEDLKNTVESNRENFVDFRKKMDAKLVAERQKAAMFKMQKSANLKHLNDNLNLLNQKAYEDRPWEGLASIPGGAQKSLSIGGNRPLNWMSEDLARSIEIPLNNALDKIGASEHVAAGTLDKETMIASYEMRPEGDMSKVKSPLAMEIAKLYRTAHDTIRSAYERAGYPIGNLPGFIMRQTHDFTKLLANKEGWIASMLKNLDHAKTFVDEATGKEMTSKEKLDVLEKTYKDITEQKFGVGDAAIPGSIHDQFISVTDKSSGSKLAGSRFYHFKDGESFYNYNSEFGKGNLRETIQSTIDRDTRNITQLGKLGAAPEAAFHGLIARMEEKYKDSPDILKKLESKKRGLLETYKIAAGTAEPVGESIYTKLSSAERNWNNISLLAATTFKKLTETAYATALVKTSLDSGFFHTTRILMKEFMHLGLPGSESEAAVAGKMYSRFINDKTISLFTDKNGAGYAEKWSLNNLSNWMYRISGINAHTNRGRIAIASTIGRIAYESSEKEFKDLPAVMRANLGRYEISNNEWNIIRRGVDTFEHDGSNAITPDAISRLSGYKPSVLDAQQKYMNYISDMTEQSVLHSNIPTQLSLRGRVDPNSVPGLLYSTAMQYKSILLMMKDVGQRVAQSDPMGKTIALGALSDAAPRGLSIKGMGQLMQMGLFATGLYALGDAAKRGITPGRDQADYNDPMTYLKYFTAASGFGLIGEPLIGAGEGGFEKFVKTVGGPVASRGADLFDAGKEALTKNKRGDYNLKGAGLKLSKFTEDLVPFQTLPGVRMALDKLLFDHINNSIDPTYLEKQELRKLRRERGIK